MTDRKEERLERYPKIVFLTAHALQDFQEQAAGAGGDGFISKPFKLDVIKSLLQGFYRDMVEESASPATTCRHLNSNQR